MKVFLACACVCGMAATAAASGGRAVDVATKSKGADDVVVGRVVNVSSRFEVNQWGDQLIVSDAEVEVEETLKGSHSGRMSMTVEGGTVGDVTLDVSDSPRMKKGDRAVLFLKERTDGGHVPWGRGNGVMKLDSSNTAIEDGLTLAEVKRMVKSAR